MKASTIVWILVVIIVLGGGWFWFFGRTAAPATSVDNNAQTPIASVNYACDAGKTIAATYYQGESKPAASPDMPPTPGGSVALTLSDGRSMTLPQTISADGTRYANADESFIFWSKGDGAFVMEGNAQTYVNCAQATSSPVGAMGIRGSADQGNFGSATSTSQTQGDTQPAPAVPR
jgi:membrane-bound inhibitor of C-type lysozyme